MVVCGVRSYPGVHSVCSNGSKRKKKATSVSCCAQVDQDFVVGSSKRTFLFVGVAVLPFVQLRASALDGLITSRKRLRKQVGGNDQKERSSEGSASIITVPPGGTTSNTTVSSEQTTLSTTVSSQRTVSSSREENQNSESGIQNIESSNPLLSLLNAIGIVGIGVLGALYALTQQEKGAAEATIESMTSKLVEMETSMVALAKFLDGSLVHDQENWINKSYDDNKKSIEQQSSSMSSNTDLVYDFKRGNIALEGLEKQIGSVLRDLSRSREDKEKLERLLPEKEKKIESVQSEVITLGAELDKARSIIVSLRQEIQESDKSIEVSTSLVNELNLAITASEVEKMKQKETIADLTKELQKTGQMLDAESSNVKGLKQKLLDGQIVLDELRNEAAYLRNQLEQTQNSYNELELERNKLQLEVSITNETHRESLEKEKQKSEALENELEKMRVQMVSILEAKVEKLESELESAKGGAMKLRSEMGTVQDDVKNDKGGDTETVTNPTVTSNESKQVMLGTEY